MNVIGKFISENTIRTAGGVFVPVDPGNRDYQCLMDEVANGAVIEELPASSVTLDDFRQAIEAHVDQVAQERQYSGAVSISTYENSTNPAWAAEAQAFVAWRDAVWIYAFTELAKVQAEERPAPESVEAFVAELPEMVWPG